MHLAAVFILQTDYCSPSQNDLPPPRPFSSGIDELFDGNKIQYDRSVKNIDEHWIGIRVLQNVLYFV